MANPSFSLLWSFFWVSATVSPSLLSKWRIQIVKVSVLFLLLFKRCKTKITPSSNTRALQMIEELEELNMEFENVIKSQRVSLSSCQVFLPPAVSQQGLICLLFHLYLAPPPTTTTLSPWHHILSHCTWHTLDQLLIRLLLHFPSWRSMAVPADGSVCVVEWSNEKHKLFFAGGLLFCRRSMRSSWLMPGARRTHCSPDAHTHKSRPSTLTDLHKA